MKKGDKVRHTGKGSALEGIIIAIRGEKVDLRIQGGVATGIQLHSLEVVESVNIEEPEVYMVVDDGDEAEKAQVDYAIDEATNFVPKVEKPKRNTYKEKVVGKASKEQDPPKKQEAPMPIDEPETVGKAPPAEDEPPPPTEPEKPIDESTPEPEKKGFGERFRNAFRWN